MRHGPAPDEGRHAAAGRRRVWRHDDDRSCLDRRRRSRQGKEFYDAVLKTLGHVRLFNEGGAMSPAVTARTDGHPVLDRRAPMPGREGEHGRHPCSVSRPQRKDVDAFQCHGVDSRRHRQWRARPPAALSRRITTGVRARPGRQQDRSPVVTHEPGTGITRQNARTSPTSKGEETWSFENSIGPRRRQETPVLPDRGGGKPLRATAVRRGSVPTTRC